MELFKEIRVQKKSGTTKLEAHTIILSDALAPVPNNKFVLPE
ncbi:hypothetical protein [Virgibacillus sp. 6R]